MLVGYARVSTQDQNLDAQLDALTDAGCERAFEEVASGARSDRPVLAHDRETCVQVVNGEDPSTRLDGWFDLADGHARGSPPESERFEMFFGRDRDAVDRRCPDGRLDDLENGTRPEERGRSAANLHLESGIEADGTKRRGRFVQ